MTRARQNVLNFNYVCLNFLHIMFQISHIVKYSKWIYIQNKFKIDYKSNWDVKIKYPYTFLFWYVEFSFVIMTGWVQCPFPCIREVDVFYQNLARAEQIKAHNCIINWAHGFYGLNWSSFSSTQAQCSSKKYFPLFTNFF